jgi:hypothetical protein
VPQSLSSGRSSQRQRVPIQWQIKQNHLMFMHHLLT